MRQIDGKKVYEKSFESAEPGMSLDSGTTYSYFPKRLYKKIVEGATKYCTKFRTRCSGLKKFEGNQCVTYKPANYPTLLEFFASFPILEFRLDGDKKYEWAPRNYLRKTPNPYDTTEKIYCIHFFEANKEKGIPPMLGNMFMRGHEIYFDKDNYSVSYVEADCDVDPSQDS